MRAVDIQIGDWFRTGNKHELVQVEEIQKNADYSSTNPIPLTQKVLIDKGFKSESIFWSRKDSDWSVRIFLSEEMSTFEFERYIFKTEE